VTWTEDGPEETDPPPNGTLVPTESPVVTWYKVPSGDADGQDAEE